MIRTIKGFFERRRVRKIFSKIVDPSVVDDLLNGKLDPRAGQFEEKTLGVVLLLVEYSTAVEVARHIRLICDSAKEHGAGYEAMTNGLMVFTFGQFPNERNPEITRRAFVEGLQTKLEKAVKIVHGTGRGHVGLAGNGHLLLYTLLMPKFAEALQCLSFLKNGEIKEIAFS